ncbi:hypothetical protein B296_00001201 [Ensete ventricosum]|uniref:Uncharacterized protein n=1 Tax=Ensete ventricosum TaxID=4639 RepID=A0A427AQE7_ENSVE|nr:hypothetical protein B296_00001201 [Ensete ventricosum]
MKKSLNDMISLWLLQEFISLISIQGKLCASTPCSIFYVTLFMWLGYFTKFHLSHSAP